MILDDHATFTFGCGHDKIVKQNRSAQSGRTSCLTMCCSPWTTLAGFQAQQPIHLKELTPPPPPLASVKNQTNPATHVSPPVAWQRSMRMHED